MSTDLSLFGGLSSAVGQRIGSGIARQTKRELDLVAARTEVAVAVDQARALLTSSSMSNVAGLIGQAQGHMQTAPEGAAYYERLIGAYTLGAAEGIARHK